MIAGICGGLAEYFKCDPTLVRLIYVGLSIIILPGILLYLIGWLIIPLEPSGGQTIDITKD